MPAEKEITLPKEVDGARAEAFRRHRTNQVRTRLRSEPSLKSPRSRLLFPPEAYLRVVP